MNSTQNSPEIVDEKGKLLFEEGSDSSETSKEELESDSSSRKVITAAAIGGIALAIGGAILLQKLQKKRAENLVEPVQPYTSSPQIKDEITEAEVGDLISTDPELSNIIREQRELQQLSLWQRYFDLEHDAMNTIISNIGKA